MYKQQKPIRIGITIKPDLLQEMKNYLKQVNDDKTMKYVSQSEFVNEAIENLLYQEKSYEKVNDWRIYSTIQCCS